MKKILSEHAETIKNPYDEKLKSLKINHDKMKKYSEKVKIDNKSTMAEQENEEGEDDESTKKAVNNFMEKLRAKNQEKQKILDRQEENKCKGDESG